MLHFILITLLILGISIAITVLSYRIHLAVDGIKPPQYWKSYITGELIMLALAIAAILFVIFGVWQMEFIAAAWFWPFVRKKNPNDEKVFGEFSRNDVWKAAIRECEKLYVKSSRERKARLRENRSLIDYMPGKCIYGVMYGSYWDSDDFRAECGEMFSHGCCKYDSNQPNCTHLEFALGSDMSITREELNYLIDIILTGSRNGGFDLSHGGKWYSDGI